MSTILLCQLGHKAQELHSILATTDFVRDFTGSIIQCNIDGNLLILAGGRDLKTLPLGHPHTHQVGMQMNLAFIQE